MNRNKTTLCAVIFAFGFFGCAGKNSAPTTAVVSNTAINNQSLSSADATYKQKLADLEKREEALLVKENTESTSSSSDTLLPPNPKVGECYARAMIPAMYKTETKKIIVAEASEKIMVTPAKYNTIQKRIEVSPAKKQLVQVPATYKWVSERILHKPAYKTWKRGSGVVDQNALKTKTTDTGELMCLVEVPAEYKTVKKKVVNKAAYTKSIESPAVYKTIAVTEMVSPAKESRIAIPAKYDTISNRVMVKDEYLEWRRVWCKTNMTRDNVLKLQKALQSKGFYRGPIDGYIGKATLTASNRYAVSKNLAYGSNYVTYDVLNNLNIF